MPSAAFSAGACSGLVHRVVFCVDASDERWRDRGLEREDIGAFTIDEDEDVRPHQSLLVDERQQVRQRVDANDLAARRLWQMAREVYAAAAGDHDKRIALQMW
jgi:hypothetical protein